MGGGEGRKKAGLGTDDSYVHGYESGQDFQASRRSWEAGPRGEA